MPQLPAMQSSPSQSRAVPIISIRGAVSRNPAQTKTAATRHHGQKILSCRFEQVCDFRNHTLGDVCLIARRVD